MMEFNLQLFGGRGDDYDSPHGDLDLHFSNGAGTKVADTLKEALGKKGKPIDMTKAYKDANPNFDRTGTYDEYNANCQRAIVAYEMRRRGYDVTAQPTYAGDTLPQRTGKKGYGRWQGAFRGAKPERVGGRNATEVVNNIEKKMRSYGDGARAVVQVSYKNANYGHVFNVERRGNTNYYVDAQTGERIRAKKFFETVKTASVTLVRTDNLRPSDRMKNFVTSEEIYKRRRR